MYVYVLIYELYTCTTVVINYVHYKAYTKIEIKKGWDKDVANLFFFFKYHYKNIFFLHSNGLSCTSLGVHTPHFGATQICSLPHCQRHFKVLTIYTQTPACSSGTELARECWAAQLMFAFCICWPSVSHNCSALLASAQYLAFIRLSLNFQLQSVN